METALKTTIADVKDMQSVSEFTWTWCPKCMIRTKHRWIKTTVQCMVCGCYHVGDSIKRYGGE